MQKAHGWFRTGPRLKITVKLLILLLVMTVEVASALPASIKGVYLPSHSITSRRIAEIIHYAGQLGLNAVVLHVKDPYGRITWASGLELARRIGAPQPAADLRRTIDKLKAHGIWTIAKLDTFADHRLVTHRPDLGLIDRRSGGPWKDKNGLYWTNPYDRRVWDYVIGLAKELAAMGFDEIQFDYIRFPSDGDLGAIEYPLVLPDLARHECIGRFLKEAHAALRSLNVIVSVDIFGLTAWKTEDFGVGQVLESIAPHVDVLCPMFYPSHFPRGFLGMLRPGDYPRKIVELSTKRIRKRTGKPVRPWIQGFWYQPEDISAQIDGIINAALDSWAVWNPTGRYGPTYRALAFRSGKSLTAPKFYPTLAELRQEDEKLTKGRMRIVNQTNYRAGYSILSLEAPARGKRSDYTTPMDVLAKLDEGIVDHILKQRGISFGLLTGKYAKTLRLAHLLCQDLVIDPRKLRPGPILINWDSDCRFTRKIPEMHLAAYQKATRKVFERAPKTFARLNRPRS